MEFANEGGAGATPYEVLLHAALVGDASHFTRQDSVEECWRVLQPLLDAPPKVIPYAQGSWGPAEAEAIYRRASAAGAAPGCPAEAALDRALQSAPAGSGAAVGPRRPLC